MHAMIPLSKLVPSKRNPRRSKPDQDAHRRLVASIKAHTMLEPLVVRAMPDRKGYFLILAGNRRYAAMKEIAKGQDPKIACNVVAKGDAEAISLAENFAREPMHPLDEAEAFARLVKEEDKDVAAIAADFGVPVSYVRQRMKLATLAKPIKSAYHENRIDTDMAEVFAMVPEGKQLEVWQEVGGTPRSAEHVRGIIEHAWIDAKNALFDVATLPPEKISQDLFGDRVLVERAAFMAAQQEALQRQSQILKDEGWRDVVVAGPNDSLNERWRMDEAEPVLDESSQKKLAKLKEKREALEAKVTEADEAGSDEVADLQSQMDDIIQQEAEVVQAASKHYGEETKAIGTVFLMLGPDGRLQKECRVTKQKPADGSSEGSQERKLPTMDDLNEHQMATLCTIQAIGVRRALLSAPIVWKRLLVMMLDDQMHSDALAIRAQSNETTAFATKCPEPVCPAWQVLREKAKALGLVHDTEPLLDDVAMYESLKTFTETELDERIAFLVTERLMSKLSKPSTLVTLLAGELAVDLRKEWWPLASWLSGYQKLQLATLTGQIQGAVFESVARSKKKSELVKTLEDVFMSAKRQANDNNEVNARANAWLPAAFRPKPPASASAETADKRATKNAKRKGQKR